MTGSRIEYRTVKLAAAVVVGLILVIIIQHRFEAAGFASESDLALLYVPDQRIMHGMALADDNTAADMLWLRSIFYFAGYHPHEHHHHHHHHVDFYRHSEHSGEHEGHDHHPEEGEGHRAKPRADGSGFDPLDFRHNPSVKDILLFDIDDVPRAPHYYRLLDMVTDLDSLFATPYFAGALNLGIMEGRWDEALRLMEKGVAALPERWEMKYYRGFIRLFYLNMKEEAVEDIRAAALCPGAPLIVIQLAAALEAGLGHVDMTLEFLKSLSEVTKDPQIKAKIDDMLEYYRRQLGRTGGEVTRN